MGKIILRGGDLVARGSTRVKMVTMRKEKEIYRKVKKNLQYTHTIIHTEL